jgi:hypothetical protein
MSDPTMPVLLGEYEAPVRVGRFTVADMKVYVAMWQSGLQIIDARDCCFADHNGDTVVDSKDFIAFLNDFVEGC